MLILDLDNHFLKISESMKNIEDPKEPSLREMLASVLAAMFGVQNSKNRARDFQKGKPAVFITLGIIVVTIFVLLIVMAVKIVMSYAPH
uniref:DUF2970 domain-containing protein n=2 Tax=Candidatus Berkiella cookevillensis TaxID=437022 RepID=A0A0Q9YAI9_9GAMM